MDRTCMQLESRGDRNKSVRIPAILGTMSGDEGKMVQYLDVAPSPFLLG